MRKILIAMCALLCTNVLLAQTPPTKEITWFGEGSSSGESQENAYERTRLRGNRSSAPVAPATLLLLGLGVSAVGVKVINNTKKH